MRWIGILLASALLSACSFVKVSEPGKAVELKTASEVEHCEVKGTTNAQVLGKIIFKRVEASMASELADLARNQAAEMGGDTIVSTSAVVDGKQSFAVYKCR